MALVLPAKVPAGEVMAVLKQVGGELMTECRLFDVYSGDRIEKGMRSLAFSLVFRSAERTLTDEEIEGPFQQILAAMEQRFDAKLRS